MRPGRPLPPAALALALAGCCAALFAAAGAPAEELSRGATAGEEPSLLGQDDECLADEPASLCGLSALQLRASPSSTAARPGPPAVCDEALVAQACERINRLTPEFFGTAADNDLSVVHAAELAEQLMVSRRSILDYLKTHLRAGNVEVDKAALKHEAFAVRCAELCNLTVLSFPAAYRPPSSDVGCYVPSGTSAPKCDIDVSPKALGGFHFDDHNPAEAESKFAESPGREGNQSRVPAGPRGTEAELRALKELDYPTKGMKQLGLAVANLFRVYPLSPIQVVDLEQRPSEKTESAMELGSDEHGEGDEFDPSGYWDDLGETDDSDDHTSLVESESTCAKDTGGTCRLFGCMRWRKADCQNRKCVCGPGKCASIFGSCVDQVDDRKDAQVGCQQDTGGTCMLFGCMGWRNAECRDRRCVCGPGKCATIFGGCMDKAEAAGSVSIDSFSNSIIRRRRDPLSGRRRWGQNVFHGGVDTKNWKDNAKKVGVYAQAYTAGALRNVNAGYAQALELKWFGKSDTAARKEIRRVVNGVHDMLSNVDYVYPGTKCRENVYAYVYPSPPNNKNSRGQYVVHLCDLYIKSDLQEQIETLTHEGSHHHAMALKDVCYGKDGPSCTRSYGRSTCEKLAKESPDKALQNADSFCFFINDAYEGGRDEVSKSR